MSSPAGSLASSPEGTTKVVRFSKDRVDPDAANGLQTQNPTGLPPALRKPALHGATGGAAMTTSQQDGKSALAGRVSPDGGDATGLGERLSSTPRMSKLTTVSEELLKVSKDQAAMAAQLKDLQGANGRLQGANGELQRGNEALSAEVQRLKEANGEIKEGNRILAGEVQSLKDVTHTSNPAPQAVAQGLRTETIDTYQRVKGELDGIDHQIGETKGKIAKIDQVIDEMSGLNNDLKYRVELRLKGGTGLFAMKGGEEACIEEQEAEIKDKMETLFTRHYPDKDISGVDESLLLDTLKNMRGALNNKLNGDGNGVPGLNADREAKLKEFSTESGTTLRGTNMMPANTRNNEAEAFSKCLESVISDHDSGSPSLTGRYIGLHTMKDDTGGHLTLAASVNEVFFDENGDLTDFGKEYTKTCQQLKSHGSDLESDKAARSEIKGKLKDLNDQLFYKIRAQGDERLIDKIMLPSHQALGFAAKHMGLDLDDQGLSVADFLLKNDNRPIPDNAMGVGLKTFHATSKFLIKYITTPFIKLFTWPSKIILRTVVTLIATICSGLLSKSLDKHTIRNSFDWAEKNILNITAGVTGGFLGSMTGVASMCAAIAGKALNQVWRAFEWMGPALSRQGSAIADGFDTFCIFGVAFGEFLGGVGIAIWEKCKETFNSLMQHLSKPQNVASWLVGVGAVLAIVGVAGVIGKPLIIAGAVVLGLALVYHGARKLGVGFDGFKDSIAVDSQESSDTPHARYLSAKKEANSHLKGMGASNPCVRAAWTNLDGKSSISQADKQRLVDAWNIQKDSKMIVERYKSQYSKANERNFSQQALRPGETQAGEAVGVTKMTKSQIVDQASGRIKALYEAKGFPVPKFTLTSSVPGSGLTLNYTSRQDEAGNEYKFPDTGGATDGDGQVGTPPLHSDGAAMATSLASDPRARQRMRTGRMRSAVHPAASRQGGGRGDGTLRLARAAGLMVPVPDDANGGGAAQLGASGSIDTTTVL